MAAVRLFSALLILLCGTAAIGKCTKMIQAVTYNCMHDEFNDSIFRNHIGQSSGSIRLWRNGSSSLSFTSGRVQLVYNSQWGNICGDVSFGIAEATVICHQLGYTGASSYSRARDDLFGNDSSLPTLLSNVSCSTSSYLVILQCSYNDTPPSSCTDDDDVSVTCCKSQIHAHVML